MNPQTLRQALHTIPEVSGAEEKTAKLLVETLAEHGLEPAATGVGGHGLVYRVGSGSPVRLFRADLDALPHGHRCGHDGHMAMLAGALMEGAWEGTVVALFQPAEETGEGMAKCLEHPSLQGPFDAVYAFHNIPGAPLGAALVGPGALASTGIRLSFEGETAHAADPHAEGDVWPNMADAIAHARDVGTVVGVHYGEDDFGIRPGAGSVSVTLRGTKASVQESIHSLQGRSPKYELVDPFPASPNDPDICRHVTAQAKAAGLEVIETKEPFTWSEDFGHALEKWPGALIGLGAGDIPNLHDRAYEFPDALLAYGIKLWRAL